MPSRRRQPGSQVDNTYTEHEARRWSVQAGSKARLSKYSLCQFLPPTFPTPSTTLNQQQATMFNLPGELLESGSLLGAPLDLKGLFILKEKRDGARRRGFPGSSRLKQKSQQCSPCADKVQEVRLQRPQVVVLRLATAAEATRATESRRY